MTLADQYRRLFEHVVWADRRLLDALRTAEAGSDDAALREAAHVIGSEENWLARILGRTPRTPIWPELGVDELAAQAAQTHGDYQAFLKDIDSPALLRSVAYTNSAGQSFDNTVADILAHVALHAQYHRGKVNLLLRRTGSEPAPADFIAFARGVPAATTADPWN